MKTFLSCRLLLVTAIILVTSLPVFGEVSQTDPSRARLDNTATEVVVIGVFHAYHQKNPYYTQQILRDIILACKPSAILVELPPVKDGNPTVVNGRLADRYDDADEGWACQASAKKLNIPIYPFDMDRRDDIRRETNYWARSRAAFNELAAWLEEDPNDGTLESLRAIRCFHNNIRSSILCYAETAGPRILNSEAFDSMLRARDQIGTIFYKLMKAHPEKSRLVSELKFVDDHWLNRNKIMTRKIVDYAAKYPKRRIVVATGAEHRRTLRDMLKEHKTITLREYWQVE